MQQRGSSQQPKRQAWQQLVDQKLNPHTLPGPQMKLSPSTIAARMQQDTVFLESKRENGYLPATTSSSGHHQHFGETSSSVAVQFSWLEQCHAVHIF